MLSSGQRTTTTNTLRERLSLCVSIAMLAPSTHNTQPWRFRMGEDHVELFADWSRRLTVSDPNGRELIMSCGAALLHLRLAIRNLGYEDLVDLFPRDAKDCLARIWLGEKTQVTDDVLHLCRAIPERRTCRHAFPPADLSSSLRQALQAAAAAEGATLRFVAGASTRNDLAGLIFEGARTQWARDTWRRELARWMRPNSVNYYGDGLPGYAFGLGDLAARFAPWFIERFAFADSRAEKERKLALDAPALAVLTTTADTDREWLAAGQALARVLLRAKADGIGAGFLNQPVQVDRLRSRLGKMLPGGVPQLVFRLGRAAELRPTPRRAVEDVLVSSNHR